MASRVRIAAAACVVASGLFATGANTAVAFADTESAQRGGDGATQAGDTPTNGTQTAAPTGSPSDALPVTGPDDAVSRTPTTGGSAPVAGVVAVRKPMSSTGDGRHGMRSGDGTGHPPSSKQSETDRRRPPQTSPKPTGEHGGPTSSTSGDESPGVPGADVPTKHEEDKTKHEEDKQHGWPWWGHCPDHHGPDDPDDPGPGLPPGNGGGGGNGGAQPKPPSGRPEPPPAMQLPPPREVPPELPNISADPVIDSATGLATAAVELPFAPITLPGIVGPLGVGGVGPGGGAGGSGAGSRIGTPSAPRDSGAPRNTEPAPKVSQQNPQAFGAGNGVPPESFRVGYGNYLRAASVGQVMAIAIPGVAGILILTGAGGLLGYRQARAGRAVRASGTSRFMG